MATLRRSVNGAEDMGRARARYRESAVGYWAAIREGDADLANTKTASADSVVEMWASTGRAEELLEPLLSDEREEVRHGAAAHLLSLGCAEKTVPILESLSANPDGLVAPTAVTPAELAPDKRVTPSTLGWASVLTPDDGIVDRPRSAPHWRD
jgi:hypothetical protein